MNKILIILSLFLIASCGPSLEEKKNIAAVTCSIMSETRNMDGAVRVREMNDAREKIGGEPFLEGDSKIKESIGYGLCQELVLGAYDETLQSLKDAQREKEQKAEKEAEKEEAEIFQLVFDRQWTYQELMAKGEAVYSVSCTGCHQSEGQGIAGIFPSLAGSSIVTGPVEGHIGILINGVAGSAMQSFADQLSEVDTAAVIHYTSNSWGNRVGTAVQPIDILNYKQAKD